MTTETLVHIRWHGTKSISEAIQFIKEHHNIEIELPANYHHACFAHLYPDADPGKPDFIDIEGKEIITKIAEVSGLEELKALLKPIEETDARVVMKSPTPRIYIGFEFNKKRIEYL